MRGRRKSGSLMGLVGFEVIMRTGCIVNEWRVERKRALERLSGGRVMESCELGRGHCYWHINGRPFDRLM